MDSSSGRRNRAVSCTFLFACFWIAGLSSPAQAVKHELTVSAAISLRDALKAVALIYQQSHKNVTLHLNAAGSGTLQRQIEQGAPVDIFISASPAEMNSLESKGLLMPGTRTNLVKNSVVLIIPGARAGPRRFEDLTNPSVKLLAIGEPKAVPAGRYAEQVLSALHLYDRLKPKLVFGQDVRQVLAYVETGNADAGIVYATDARISPRVKAVAVAPEQTHSPVIYPVAVLKNSSDPSAAEEFVSFLSTSAAMEIFQRYGFTPASKPHL